MHKAFQFTIAAVMAAGMATPVQAQTLDQKAWNAVWDRLAQVLPANTPTESVHALRVIVPATWATGKADSLRELQTYAGALPAEEFSIDPSRLKLLLHQVYANFVLDVDLPDQTPAEKAKLAKAADEYNRAVTNLRKVIGEYNTLWEGRQKVLEKQGEAIDSAAELNFRTENAAMFTAPMTKVELAASELLKHSPPNAHWLSAWNQLNNQVKASTSGPMLGIFPYEGGRATLDTIAEDCTEDGPGWDKILFSSKIESQSYRTSNWNGNGSWGGSFFSIGGSAGGSDYNKFIDTTDELVELSFCKLTYIPLKPGSWFDVSFLQEIDAGNFAFRKGSEAGKYIADGKKLLARDGKIPRLVKGAVVARRVRFLAKLNDTHLKEVRQSSGGGGGFGIGPFRIGGGGGSSSFTREYTEKTGFYGRSTASNVPVIIAIITEPTYQDSPPGNQ